MEGIISTNKRLGGAYIGTAFSVFYTKKGVVIMFKKLFNKLFDYVIVGDYYTTVKTGKGTYAYKKKYIKKYYPRFLNRLGKEKIK